MMTFRIIGAAVALSSMIVGPAMAQRTIAHPNHYAQSNYCATREPGNPYSQKYDYMAWSAWRARGGWDSRGDDACYRNPQIHYRQLGL
jgi:hypothetical protein